MSTGTVPEAGPLITVQVQAGSGSVDQEGVGAAGDNCDAEEEQP